MGQKENPIALRLSINRTIDSSWYSDTKYASLHSYDTSIRHYVQSIYKSGKIIPSRMVSHILPKRHSVHLTTFQNTKKKKRNENEVSSLYFDKKGLFQEKQNELFVKEGYNEKIEKKIEKDKIHYIKNNSLETKNDILSSFTNENIFCRSFLLHAFEKEKRKIAFNSVKPISTQFFTNQPIPIIENKNTQGIESFTVLSSCIQGFHQNHIEKTLSRNGGITTNFSVFKTCSSFQSAFVLCSLIQQGFEKRQSFRKVWDTIIKDLPSTPKKSFFVKGIRIVCSGRLGGVEMAKTDIRKWGETPLHSFHQKIDYAETAAFTRFGKIGVKVWICYR